MGGGVLGADVQDHVLGGQLAAGAAALVPREAGRTGTDADGDLLASGSHDGILARPAPGHVPT